MSFTDDYLALQKKKKKKEEQKTTKKTTGHSFTDDYLSERGTAKEEDIAPLFVNKTASLYQDRDIAPFTTVKATSQKDDDEDERKWFEKGEFEDGYQLGDITRTILGTSADIKENLLTGIVGMGEKIVDAGAYVAGGVGGLLGADSFKDKTKDFIKKDLYDEEKVAKKILGMTAVEQAKGRLGIDSDTSSVLGEKSDSLVQSGGQLLATAGLQTVGVPWFVTTGLTSFGGEVESAFKQDATYGEAGVSAAISAGAEMLTEKISGGIKFGGKALDDVLTQRIARGISNKVVRSLSKLGMDMAGEGFEEVLSGAMSAIGQKITYADDKELTELFSKEDALEAFIGGAVLGGGVSGVNLASSAASGVDYASGLTANEKAVVDKVFNDRVSEEEKSGKVTQKRKDAIYSEVLRDMERGSINIDTIEEVLGGESYNTYKRTVDREDSLLQEYEELGKKQNATLAEQTRYNELHQQVQDIKQNSKRDLYKTNLSENVQRTVQTDRLAESYNERARRGQAFEADLTKYDTKQRDTIQKAVESGILNNTNRTHEFVDMIAKISADKGVLFDFTNNERLKESGFAVENKQVNGYVTKDGVTLNIDSAKSLNSVVGHEITHVLEGTELYTALQSAVTEYAKGKGDYQGRYDSLSKLYEGVEGANVDAELTADLVGDYLFTDPDFINNLSVNHRNVFQKIYDEIKYLYKVATAGSKEARELEKVKKAFEEAYRGGGKAQGDTKYSLTIKHTDGTVEELADARGLTDEQAVNYLNQAKSGALQGGSYIPVRKDTPQVIIDTLTGAGENVENLSLVMQVRKAQQAMSTENRGNRTGKHGSNVRKHALTPEEVVEIVNKLDDPSMVILQTNRHGKNGDALPNNVAVFVEYNKNGKEGVAVIEFESSIDPQFIGTEYGDTSYHTVVTVFEPDVERNGEPFDYAEELLSNPDNIELKIERRQPTGSATREKHPNTSSELPSFGDIVAQEGKTVNYSLSDSEGRELSPAIQKRFANSKAVDENGNLKVLYHGTYNGEFSIFDKAKGYVEDDYGSGFYFSDNEADVSEHYEGGGPDYENKVVRLAEQIADEEDIDMDEAEGKAREQLFKGSHRFEVYLNIEKPAIVGETILMDGESYMEQYDEGDYDDYDDYIADVEQLVADDIDNIVWEVEQKVEFSDFGGGSDGIRNVLWEAYAEGGIGLEELKSKINDLYLEDDNGQLVGNEIARQIIESLGYDGIIDPTVSGKWNMDIEEGTTHYIVFKPNQIKAVTNENPTDNPDIHKSLSREGEQVAPVGKYNVYGKDIALETAPVQETQLNGETATENATPVPEDLFPDDLAPMVDDPERLDSLTDADMPPEAAAPYTEDGEVTVDDPFEERDWYQVGNRKVNAYMYENPEVKPFFQEEAAMLLSELKDTIKGERWYNDDLYYQSGGEQGFGGTKRMTSDSIATLLDDWEMSYADIEKGLNAILEDNGAENIAAAKKIEFMLNDRLLNGYKDFYSRSMTPPNEEYIKLLNEKQITQYSKEAFDAYMANADSYAPPAEDIAPVAKPAARGSYMAAPVEKYEAIAPKRVTKQPRMARATPEEQARAEILVDEPKVEKKKSGVMAKLKNLVLDKGMIFEDLSLKTGNRELQARWDSIRRAESRAQRFMENGSAMSSSLKSIREGVEKTGKTQQFYEYLYHLHNADRMTLADRYADVENKPVFGSSITADISKIEIAELEKRNPEFKRLAQEVYNYMGSLRKMLVDGGVISEETAQLWQEMYPHYVPIRREGKDGLNINVPLDSRRTGINAPIKKATGGNSNILPLFDTMGQRTIQTFKAIAKNRFGVELKDTLGTTIDREAAGLDEVIEGVDTHEELLKEGKNGMNPTFTVFENGEKVTFEITDEMYDSIKPKSDTLAYTNKTLNTISNVRRGVITEYNPWFLLKNAIKDSQDLLINSQHPARTYAAIPKAMKQMASNGHWYQEYLDNGGEQDTYFENETNTFKEENKTKELLFKVTGLAAISKANNVVERLPRLAEYIASRESGRSVDVSMLDAARVTTNFAAGGDFTKFLNRNGATFLNASVQGAIQNVRNFREAKMNGFKGWASLAGKFVAAGLPAIVLNHFIWDDDEEYEELSDYVKQNYYIVGKFGDGKFVRIPKGRTVAVIQNAIEQVSKAASGDDEADWGSFFELLLTNLAPNNPIDNNILSPIYQVAQNKTWYGEDLIPTRLADLPAAEQYDESTDSLSRWLGETFNVSPYKANYLIDQYSGVLGDTFLPMMTPEAESGNNTFAGNMIAPLKDMFTADSVMNNQNVSDFYDKKDELKVNANASGATEKDVLMNKYMNSMNADLAKLYAEKRKIQNSDLPDAEKYAAVRDVQKQIVELSKEGLDTYGDISYENDIAVIGEKYFKQNNEGEWAKLSDDQVRKHKITSAAGDVPYATDGTVHYRLNDGGNWRNISDWTKISDKDLARQKEVTKELGITPEEYWSKTETSFIPLKKGEYEYAYDNPESYAVAKAVGGYDAYKGFSSDLSDIKADKDESGKSITGSRKEKVLDYVNGLDIEAGEKYILFKNEYNADDTYNYEIIDYLNSREDISFEEMETILKKLGFEVSSDGTISW